MLRLDTFTLTLGQLPGLAFQFQLAAAGHLITAGRLRARLLAGRLIQFEHSFAKN